MRRMLKRSPTREHTTLVNGGWRKCRGQLSFPIFEAMPQQVLIETGDQTCKTYSYISLRSSGESRLNQQGASDFLQYVSHWQLQIHFLLVTR